MVSKCNVCGTHLGEEHPQMNDNCVDCLADQWGEIIEKSPMVSPQALYKSPQMSITSD